MTDLLRFTSIAEAMLKGRQAVKGNFSLDEGTEGNMTEEEKNYICTFNSNWAAKGQPLASQISKFLAACFKAEGLLEPQLKIDPGLTMTQEIVNSWRQITMLLHPEFVLQMTQVTEKLFSCPDIKVKLSAQMRMLLL